MAKLTINALLSLKQALESHGFKSRGGEYRGSHPTRPGSDSNGFSVKFDDSGDGGTFTDFGPSGDSGNLTALCKLLSITPEYEQNGNVAVGNKAQLSEAPPFIPYTPDEFAAARGALWNDYEKAGYVEYIYNDLRKDGTYLKRPCYKFPVLKLLDGKEVITYRYRFTDGLDARFKHDAGFSTYWYGLKRAIEMEMGYIILVNGETSTVAAQANGLPAVCMTTSGEKGIPEHLNTILKYHVTGRIFIALDGDQTGRGAAAMIHDQLPGSVVINLKIDNGDMGDFCRMHQGDVLSKWDELVSSNRPTTHLRFINESATLQKWENRLDGKGLKDRIKPIIFPIRELHQYRGSCLIMRPRTVVMVIAPSSGGKTAFLLWMADLWRRDHKLNIMYWGDEFDELGYMDMYIRRWYGIDDTLWLLDDLAQQEDAASVPKNRRYGKRLHDQKGYENINIPAIRRHLAVKMETWGKFTLIENRPAVPLFLDELADEMAFRAANGYPIHVVFIDYIGQMAKTKAEAQTADEQNVAAFQAFANKHNIIIVMGSQTTEGESRNNASQGKVGNMNSGKWISPGPAKLILNLRIGKTARNDGSFERIPLNDGVMVSKNSGGQVNKFQHIPFEGRWLRWGNIKS